MDITLKSLSLNPRAQFTTACLLICVSIFVVYYPGLTGDFEFDDSINILNNHALEINEFSLKDLYQASTTGGFAGPLKRPISIATFVVNRYLTGVDPFYMKLTNVVIHILVSLGIYFLSLLLIRACFQNRSSQLPDHQYYWLALIITLAWSLHPLLLTSNLYIVQRMTSLSALFSVGGLITYVVARQRMIDNKNGALLLCAGFLVFGLASAFSKENGLLLPLYTLVIEVTLFRFQVSSNAQKYFLYAFYSLTIIIPSIIVAGILVFSPGSLLGAYSNRHFDLAERVMTEGRVLWFYLSLILTPDISQMGIYHDDIAISRGLLTPWTTLPALAGLLALIVVAFAKRKTMPVLSFALLFFFAGHSLESTIIPLEITHEHRNYLPMYGIIFGLVFYLSHPLLHPSSLKFRNVVALFFIAVLAVSTTARASYWGSLLEHSLIEAQNHPESSRAQYQAGRIYFKLAIANPENRENLFLQARNHFENTAKVSVNKNNALIALIHLSFFAEFDREQHWLKDLLRELSTTRIPSSTPAAIHAYTMCQIKNKCALTHNEMQSIYDAALGNPTLKSNARSAILSSAGMYTENRSGLAAALPYFEDAAESARGRLSYRITLAGLYSRLGRFEDASHHLELSKQNDRLGAYTQKIAETEAKILKNRELISGMIQKVKNSDNKASISDKPWP